MEDNMLSVIAIIISKSVLQLSIEHWKKKYKVNNSGFNLGFTENLTWINDEKDSTISSFDNNFGIWIMALPYLLDNFT